MSGSALLCRLRQAGSRCLGGLLLSLPGLAQAQGFDARWGLQWGQTAAEVRERVQGWQAMAPDGELQRMAVRSRLMQHPAFPFQVLGFRQGRLVEVRAFSTLMADDAEGRKGRAAHLALAQLLNARYGPPDAVHEHMLPRQSQPPEGFYGCLRLEGCAIWARSWRHAEAFVVLDVQSGKAPGSGWLLLRAMAPH